MSDGSPSLRDSKFEPPAPPIPVARRPPARPLAPVVPVAARPNARQQVNTDIVPLGRRGRAAGTRGRGRGRGRPPRNKNPAPQPSEASIAIDEGVGTEHHSDDAELAGVSSSRCGGASVGSSSSRVPGRVPTPPPVPDMPPPDATTRAGAPLLSSEASIAIDESYGNDERVLNEMLKTHSMLSMEATSQKTLQLVASMFERSNTKVAEVAIVGKSYDDTYLRPPNKQIGERPCACGDNCICLLMARIRHGPDTDLAFIGAEFLLPAERSKWASGVPLTTRRKKCLLCTRYLQNLLYVKARTDPNFTVSNSSISLQVFGNPVAPPPRNSGGGACNMDEISETMQNLPENASYVSSRDGYKPQAMLFVDEDFASSSRAAREGRTSAFSWKPVVKFNSSHYKYVHGATGPSIVQVGIGADDVSGHGLFQAPPVAQTALLAAQS